MPAWTAAKPQARVREKEPFWDGKVNTGFPNFGFLPKRSCFTGLQPTGGILFANRNKGQRDDFSARIAWIDCLELAAALADRVLQDVSLLFSSRPAGFMTDSLSVLMSICAAVGSMAFGVLAAYAIFRIAFGLMKPQDSGVPVKTRPETAGIL
jgi:ABC-type glycerol-3-phosphate transport system permease component